MRGGVDTPLATQIPMRRGSAGTPLAAESDEMDAPRVTCSRHARMEREGSTGAIAKLIRIYMVIGAVAGMVWGSSAVPVRINWTRSAPLGLYATLRQAPIARADLVVVCLRNTLAARGRARGYLTAGSCPNRTSPILRQVAATAADEVELRSDGIEVNGRVVDRAQRRHVDSLGRPFELFPHGRSVVREGEVWVLGVNRERSWDSRYFGPIPVSSIIGMARPILTLNVSTAQ